MTTPTSPNLPEPATCEDCLTVVAYLRATKDGVPIWGENCVCQNPVYPSDPDGSDTGSISMPLVRLSDAQLLAAEVERLRAALTNTRQALEEANDAHSGGPIQDTIWMPAHISKAETLFDYIDAALDASRLALKEAS